MNSYKLTDFFSKRGLYFRSAYLHVHYAANVHPASLTSVPQNVECSGTQYVTRKQTIKSVYELATRAQRTLAQPKGTDFCSI